MVHFQGYTEFVLTNRPSGLRFPFVVIGNFLLDNFCDN